MTEERPPPPVSVRDPSLAGARHEALELREPLLRRPSRRTTVVLSVVLLLALGLSRALTSRDLGRREQAQAVVEVVLATGVDQDPGPDGRYSTAAGRMDLRNAGPATVEVVGVDVPGWSSSWRRGPLAAGAQLAVAVTAPLACGSLPQPGAVTLRLRTRNGEQVVRRVPLDAQDLLYAALLDCGQVPVQGALSTSVQAARLDGQVLQLDLALHNTSTAPLRLVSVSGDGARVVLRPGVPLDVAPRVPGRVPEALPVHASVSVASCPAALRGLFGAGLVSLELDAESGQTVVTSRLTPSLGVLTLTRQLVRRACPGSEP